MQQTEAKKIPDELVEVQCSLENLQYAQRVRKTIPNLPKGKLRDHIEEELNAIINYDESPLKAKLTALETLSLLVRDLNTKCAHYSSSLLHSKRTPVPQELIDLVDDVHKEIQSFLGLKGTY